MKKMILSPVAILLVNNAIASETPSIITDAFLSNDVVSFEVTKEKLNENFTIEVEGHNEHILTCTYNANSLDCDGTSNIRISKDGKFIGVESFAPFYSGINYVNSSQAAVIKVKERNTLVEEKLVWPLLHRDYHIHNPTNATLNDISIDDWLKITKKLTLKDLYVTPGGRWIEEHNSSSPVRFPEANMSMIGKEVVFASKKGSNTLPVYVHFPKLEKYNGEIVENYTMRLGVSNNLVMKNTASVNESGNWTIKKEICNEFQSHQSYGDCYLASEGESY